jgi:hypothetical protein
MQLNDSAYRRTRPGIGERRDRSRTGNSGAQAKGTWLLLSASGSLTPRSCAGPTTASRSEQRAASRSSWCLGRFQSSGNGDPEPNPDTALIAEVLVRSETAQEAKAVAGSVSEACRDEFVPGSLPPADLSRSAGNEPDLCKHPLRGDVLIASRRSESP